MGLIKNQEGTAMKCPEPVPQRADIRLVDQQALRDQETRVGAPGIHGESAFATYAFHIVLVEDLESQAKTILKLLLPLEKH